MALKLWQLAVVAGVAAGALLSLVSLGVGLVFAVFVPLSILAAARDVDRSRRRNA
jgi:hypothetical protein